MIKGFNVAVGVLDSNGNIHPIGAATDGQLRVGTQMIGKAGTETGCAEYLPDVSSFELSVSGYLMLYHQLHDDDVVQWACRLGNEIWSATGRVENLQRAGSVKGAATYSMTIVGAGGLTSSTVLDNRWILATGRWRDEGVWIDTEFWKDN